jgi:hypothetical protein
MISLLNVIKNSLPLVKRAIIVPDEVTQRKPAIDAMTFQDGHCMAARSGQKVKIADNLSHQTACLSIRFSHGKDRFG